jgi:energy-coupling factor transport system permease protein
VRSGLHRRGDPPVEAPLHAAAWWLWALGLAGAASRTTNPLLLGLILAVAGYVVAARRTDAPWAGSFGVFLRLALVVICIRTAFHVLLGGVSGTTVLVTLPELTLPEWAQGIRLGGEVSAEGLASAVYDGLRLGVLLACVGAANALANPKRMLRSLPAALYEVSVAVVVALSTAPQLVASTRRIKRAQALRGGTAGRWRGARAVLVPVLEDAFERSLELAAAMDSRGYGRTGETSAASRRVTGALVLAGLGGISFGVYGVLGGTASMSTGLIALVVGSRPGGGRARRRCPTGEPQPLPARPLARPGGGGGGQRHGAAGGAPGRRGRRHARTGPPHLPAGVPLAAVAARPRGPGRPPARRRRARPRPGRAPRSVGGGRVIRFEGVTFTYPDAPAPVLAGIDLQVPEGELCVVVGAPAPASRPSCVPSTAWSRTSPGGRCRGRCSSTAAAPGTTRPGSWPTWWASSARTPSPGSSPTASRTSWPTPWSPWASTARRCAAGSRRCSTCSAWPSCGAGRWPRSRGASSSASPSVPP